MYLVAYQNIYANTGNITKGSDNKTINSMSLERINKIINSLKDESYQPKASRRTYIKKKNGKNRPLGIPSFDDKLLQEIVRMILEAIYESYLEDTSHGFRTNKNCHTASTKIQCHILHQWGSDVFGNITRLDNILDNGIAKKLDNAAAKLDETKHLLEVAKK